MRKVMAIPAGRNTAIVRVVSLFQDSFKDDVFYDNVRDGAFDIFYAGIFTKLLFRRCKNLHRMFTILREESVRSSSYCIAWSFLIDDDRLDSAATGNERGTHAGRTTANNNKLNALNI